VRPEVVQAIADAARAADGCETGGPLLGTVQRSWDGARGRLIAGVLGTVVPRTADADRSWVRLGPDGVAAAAALSWWREVTGLDLLHLGDWHVHPAGRPEPSAGDRCTAAEMAAASTAPLWLTAVAVPEAGDAAPLTADRHLVTRHQGVGPARIGFHRAAEGLALRPTPVRVEGEALPRLPSLPWHVADPARFAAECRLLDAAGYALALDGLRADQALVRVHRDGEPARTIATSGGYPSRPPVLIGPDGKGRIPDGWRPDRFLVDVVEDAA
jgi:hypothetical protein